MNISELDNSYSARELKNPSLVNDFKTLAKKYLKDSKYDLAIKEFQKVLDIEAKDEESYYQLGNIFHLRGEIGKAIKSFSKVIEINPFHTDASIALSVLYNDIGRYEKAKEIFNNANQNLNRPGLKENDSELNKKFSHKHFELAQMYMSFNRFEEALFEFEKSFNLDPTNLNAKLFSAKVYAKKGMHSKSIDCLKKLIRDNPRFFSARIGLGLVYYSKGEVIHSIDEWKKILSIDPNNQEAKTYIAMAEKRGETSL